MVEGIDDVPSVLVIDDESELSEALMSVLRSHGFAPDAAATLARGREQLDQADLVLLDLGLPDGDGLTVCREFSDRVPVIVISARNDEVDRILALEMGADDYLGKPFSSRELVARCRAVLRRSTNRSSRSTLDVADLQIDWAAYEVRRGGEPLSFTAKEFELLAVLAAHAGEVLRRSRLAVEVWGTDLGFVSRTLEVHVSSLRAKLGPGPDGGDYITTVRGIGYRMRR